jgi:hypothetical protein
MKLSLFLLSILFSVASARRMLSMGKQIRYVGSASQVVVQRLSSFASVLCIFVFGRQARTTTQPFNLQLPQQALQVPGDACG